MNASPASAFYASSKAAVELVSDGLRKEVALLGIQVMVVEPGAFRTNFFSSSLKSTQMKIVDYKDTAWKRYPENAADQHLTAVGYNNISVMNHLSIDCDCNGNSAEPDMHDRGILASTDQVTLDQACVDLVYVS